MLLFVMIDKLNTYLLLHTKHYVLTNNKRISIVISRSLNSQRHHSLSRNKFHVAQKLTVFVNFQARIACIIDYRWEVEYGIYT